MSRRYKGSKKTGPSEMPVPSAPIRKAKSGAQSGRTKVSQQSYQSSRSNKSVRTVVMIVALLVVIVSLGLLIASVAGEILPWQLSDEISPDQARRQIAKGALVVDVRTNAEYLGGHIQGSLNMPLEELTTMLDALSRDTLIITVCRTGLRSIQARYILMEEGFTQVTSLKGGMEAWIKAGFPVEKGEPRRINY